MFVCATHTHTPPSIRNCPWDLLCKNSLPTSDREEFPVEEILVFASPTSYMLTSFGFPLLKWVYSSIDSSRMICNSPEVSNFFNRLFLKLNRFIWNKLPVLPNHRFRQAPKLPLMRVLSQHLHKRRCQAFLRFFDAHAHLFAVMGAAIGVLHILHADDVFDRSIACCAFFFPFSSFFLCSFSPLHAYVYSSHDRHLCTEN